jgi:hypothetical protein
MIMPILKNTYFGFTVAGSSKGETFTEEELQSKYRPRFGRNWWYWLPTFRSNGGRFRSYENTDINFHWLCFAMWITIYAWKCVPMSLRVLPDPEEDEDTCTCHRCIEEKNLITPWGFPLSSGRMILCPECGNKRCPKASDHRHACTNSNEPGQPGSIYPKSQF